LTDFNPIRRSKFCENDAEGLTNDEQCQTHDEYNTTQLFVVGEGVNAKTGGEPYLAVVITKIIGDDIFVKFPYGRYHNYEYKYNQSQLLPFTTQFPNRQFKPNKRHKTIGNSAKKY